MTDIFVSYSRKDEVFGRKIHSRLKSTERNVWMDWEDIPFNADWWQEIKRGIETSDNFMVILTDDFVCSPVCMLEVEHARRNNKRILIVAHNFTRTGPNIEALNERLASSEIIKQLLGPRDLINISQENWSKIGHVNWLFFNDDSDFEQTFYQLIETLDTDLNHVRAHTSLQVRALDWFTNNKNWSFLLTGVQIDQAEEWLSDVDKNGKSPEPTTIHREFIQASRQQHIEQEQAIERMQNRAKRFRQVSLVSGVIATIMVIVGFALTTWAGSQVQSAQSRVADSQNQQATANAQAEEAGETLTAIPPTFEAIRSEIAAVGETLTPIGATLAAAENAREEAQALADNAQIQVVEANTALEAANEALTPVAVTLTQSAQEQATANALIAESDNNLATANVDSMTAQALLESANVQVADAQVQIIEANDALREANATLSPIAPTLTQASNQIAEANDASTESAARLESASTQIAAVSTEVADANATLAGVVPTLTEASNQVVEAGIQVASANTEVANVATQVADAERAAEENRSRARSQSLITSAEQAVVNGDIDLALALALESYDIDPNLAQTRRLLNNIAYTSARFILPDASFVTFSSDSRLVAYGDGNEVVIMDIASREEVTRLTAHTDNVVAGDFSLNNELFVTGSEDTNVIVWDTQTWNIVETLSDHNNPITDVTFDNQSVRIGAVDNGSTAIVWLLNATYQAITFSFNNDDTSLYQIEFIGDESRFLAWGTVGDNEVYYRANIATGDFVRRTDGIFTSLNPAYQAGQIRVWGLIDTESFINIYSVVNTDNRPIVFATGFNWNPAEDVAGARALDSTGARVVVALSNRREGRNDLVLFNVDERQRNLGIEFVGNATEYVSALAFSPNGQTVLSGFGRYLVLWDTLTGRELRRFGAHLDEIADITYSLDSRYAITRSRDGEYRVWDVDVIDTAVINQIAVPENTGSVGLNPSISTDNNELFFASAANVYRAAINQESVQERWLSYSDVTHVFYGMDADQPLLSTIHDNTNGSPTIRIWDISESETVQLTEDIRINTGETIDTIGTFSSDTRLMAVSMSDFVRVYEIDVSGASAIEIASFDRAGLVISDLVFDTNGDNLYAAINRVDDEENYSIVRWNIESSERSIIQISHSAPITAIAINSDATQILTASADNTLILFNLENKILERRLIGHQESVEGVYFGQDDTALSASRDGTLILWDLGSGQLIRRYASAHPITGLYLSNDSTLAISTNDAIDGNHTVTIWRIETLDDVIDWVSANRDIPPLTAEQCIQYDIINCDE